MISEHCSCFYARLFSRICYVLFILFFLCVVQSCALTANRPEWENNPQYKLKKVMKGFYGSGVSDNLSDAKLISYENLFRQIEEYLGHELSLEDFRELITTDSISGLGINIINSFSIREGNGFYYSVQAAGQISRLDKFRTEEAIKSIMTVREVESLVKKGDECFIENEDVKGLYYYIKSLCLSKGLDEIIDKDYRYNTVFSLVKDILNNIKIGTISEDPANGTCSFRVMRFDTILPSRVKNSEVVSFFNAIDSNYTVYQDSFVFTTDEKGDVSFNFVNANTVKEGSVVFTLNLYDVINELALFSYEDAAELYDCLSVISYSFNYKKEYAGKIGIYSYEFLPSENDDTENVLSSLLADKMNSSGGFNTYVFHGINEFVNDYETINEFRKNNSEDVIIVVSSSINDIIKMKTGGVFVALDVEITLSRDSEEMKKINYTTSGAAKEFADALEIAYQRFSDIAFSKLVVIFDNRYRTSGSDAGRAK